MKAVSRQLSSVGIPPDDVTELASRDLWLQMLPIVLCVLAWLVTILHCYMAHYALATVSRVLGLLFCWWVCVCVWSPSLTATWHIMLLWLSVACSACCFVLLLPHSVQLKCFEISDTFLVHPFEFSVHMWSFACMYTRGPQFSLIETTFVDWTEFDSRAILWWPHSVMLKFGLLRVSVLALC